MAALLTALKKVETDQNCIQEQMKASEKLGKVLNEADIRLLVASMEQKNGAEVYVISISSLVLFSCICLLFPIVYSNLFIDKGLKSQSNWRRNF